MRIGSIADPHARGKDLSQLAAQLDEAAEVAAVRGATMMMVPGDVFDRPGIGDSYASTGAIADVVCRWAADVGRGMRDGLHLIPGNHDLAGNGSRDALHVLDQIRGVSVYHQPGLFQFDGFHVVFLPWSWTGSALAAIHRALAVPASELSGPGILCAHVQVIGATMTGERACEDKPGSWQISRADLAALPFDRFILGDFHRRQEVAPGRGGYVGALRQLNHGEEGNPAGVEIYDTETGAVEWIELDAAPRYRTVQIDNPMAEALSPVRLACNEITRVQIIGEPDMARVAELEAAGATVERLIPRVERTRRAEVAPGILQDPHGLLALWADQQSGFETDRRTRMNEAFDHLMADKEARA